MNLTEVLPYIEFQIESIGDSTLEIKLLELGFSVGSNLELVRKAPFNGPLTIRNSKAQIILRNEDALLVHGTSNRI
ncbi:MAG: FeoA family protein [Salibacteraceae bacterium]